jgi:hypothetical protein
MIGEADKQVFATIKPELMLKNLETHFSYLHSNAFSDKYI